MIGHFAVVVYGPMHVNHLATKQPSYPMQPSPTTLRPKPRNEIQPPPPRQRHLRAVVQDDLIFQCEPANAAQVDQVGLVGREKAVGLQQFGKLADVVGAHERAGMRSHNLCVFVQALATHNLAGRQKLDAIVGGDADDTRIGLALDDLVEPFLLGLKGAAQLHHAAAIADRDEQLRHLQGLVEASMYRRPSRPVDGRFAPQGFVEQEHIDHAAGKCVQGGMALGETALMIPKNQIRGRMHAMPSGLGFSGHALKGDVTAILLDRAPNRIAGLGIAANHEGGEHNF